MAALFSRASALFLLLLLAACSTAGSNGSWLADVHPARHGVPLSRNGIDANQPGPNAGAPGSGPVAFSRAGTGVFTGSTASVEEVRTPSGEPGVTLNLVNVPVSQATQTVLGDLLGLNFVVDERVEGMVTVQTTSPVSKTAMVDLFETVLRSRGAAIVEDAGFYRVVPDSDARAGVATKAAAGVRPGLSIQVVPLAYTSAEEVRGILEPIAPAGGILNVDPARNLLVLTGTAAELASMREAIALFDVDWMKGMSFALHPLESTAPEAAIARELDTIFATGTGPLKGVVRFLPNRRLNAILVISARPHYLPEAATWIERLDRAAGRSEDKLVTYTIHDRTASELTPVLRAIG